MGSHAIAVLGENLVDLLISPDASINAVVGGGPLNVARTIGRLGGEAHFVSGISSDIFGDVVRESLEESGVNVALPEALIEPTTLAVVELNALGPRYHFHLNNTAAFCLDTSATTSALAAISDLSAMYFGTLGLLVEPMASLGEALIMSSPVHTLIVIDPNCRPSAVRDHEEYRARVARLSSRADVVKVSAEDLEYLHPELSRRDAARRVLGHGATCVVVTDGAAAVTILTKHFEVTESVAPTPVVDTVGAGDALVGGFLRWWTGHDLTSRDLDNSDALGCAIGAAIEISRLTCQRAGAEPPRHDEVRALPGWRWL